MRVKLAQTASALNGSPSENFTPCLSLKVQVRPSAEGSQLSASSGWTSAVPGLTPSRPWWIWRVTRKVSPSVA